MSFGGFDGDFNMARASDRCLPDGFLQSLNKNPFLKNQSSDGLDLCQKLNQMGISCDMSIWSKPTFRVDPDDFGSRRALHGFSGFEQNLDGFRNVSSARQVTSHGVSPVDLRFLGVQDSVNLNGFDEMVAFKNHRDFRLDQMNRPIKRLSPSLRPVSLENAAFQGSLMFERNRVSNALPAMDGSGGYYPEISLRGVSLSNDAFKGSSMFEGQRLSRALTAMEVSRVFCQEDSLRGVSLGNDAFKGSSLFEEKRVSQAVAAMEVSGACRRGVSLGNDAFKGSSMFEGKRVSRALTAMEEDSRAFCQEDSLRGVSLGNVAFKGSSLFEEKRVSQAVAAMEISGPSYPEDTLIRQGSFGKMSAKTTCDLRLNLASMVNIYGSVNLMAKDQIGCKALQELVVGGTFHDFEVLFLEIINHVAELSMDQFGNYLVQKMLEMCDEEQRTLIVSVFTSNLMVLTKICLNNYGTRVVQKIIQTVKTKQQIGMVKSGLEPCFLALVRDLNGNHVIQACLNSLGPNDNKFVLEAATKYCAEIATHRHGCCVLQCCVSNSVGEQRERLVNEISRNAVQLSQDPFGNYVVQYLIEQNVPAGKLLMQFRSHYAKLATQKFSSHVVEKCLKHFPESRAEIVRELLSVPSFEYLLQDPFGNYVIQTALSKTKGRVRAQLVEQVHKYTMLKSSPYCKKIFSKRILKK